VRSVLDKGTLMYEKFFGGLLDMYVYMDVQRTGPISGG
jgi:hypothetical protein